MGCHFLLQGIFPLQGSNPRLQCLLHWQADSLLLSHLGSSISSVQFSRSVVSDSLRPHEPRSTPGLPVHHHLPEFTQTHFHQVSDAIQPSHPLSTPSPPAPKSLSASESFPMSQLFAWVTKVLEFQLQHHSFQRNPRAGFLQNGLVGSPCSPSILFAYFFYIKILFPNFLALW